MRWQRANPPIAGSPSFGSSGPAFAARAAAHDADDSFVADNYAELGAHRVFSAGRLVGEMENELTAARLALRHMLDVAAPGPMGAETSGQVLAGSTLVANAAIKTVERAMEAVGGARYHQVRARFGCEQLNP